MKYPALLVSGAVILTAAVSSTVAAITYFQTQPQVTESRNEVREAPAKTSIAANSPNSTPLAVPASPEDDFKHWRIQLVDESNQSPEFAQFLTRLKQAVRDRDAQYIRSIVTPKTKLGFGEHRSINFLNPDNPKSPFWSELEKSLALGCTSEATYFSCPTTFRQFDAAIKDAPANQRETAYEASIIVVGQGVNVRSQPTEQSTAIATLSNEIVRFDAETARKAPEQMRAETFNLSNLDGWIPVILPNDKHGYVSNRYAYSPLGHRALFAKEDGKWIMQAFVVGD